MSEGGAKRCFFQEKPCDESCAAFNEFAFGPPCYVLQSINNAASVLGPTIQIKAPATQPQSAQPPEVKW